ncbi:MAG: hypothetical protein AB1349_06830 [Elusimicrobiota bacterium]
METGIGLAIVGVLLSWVWYINNKNNNRVIKETTERTEKLIKEVAERTEKLIIEESKLTREMLKELFDKMDTRFEKLDIKAEERHKEVIELLKKGFGVAGAH